MFSSKRIGKSDGKFVKPFKKTSNSLSSKSNFNLN
jgi:hypothetical protein